MKKGTKQSLIMIVMITSMVFINKVSIGLLFTFIFYPKNGPFVYFINLLGYQEKINVLGDVHLAM